MWLPNFSSGRLLGCLWASYSHPSYVAFSHCHPCFFVFGALDYSLGISCNVGDVFVSSFVVGDWVCGIAWVVASGVIVDVVCPSCFGASLSSTRVVLYVDCGIPMKNLCGPSVCLC